MWPTRVCRASRLGTLVSVPGTGSATYVLGPLLIAALLGVLLLVVRWAFGRGPAAAGRPRPEYGLLQPVAAARTTDQLEPVRLALDSAGIRCTVSRATDGHRLLVWPDDAARARDLVRRVTGSS